MGIASLILGIISLIMSLIPVIGFLFCIPATMGIILGIISLCEKKDKGKSIAGIITSSLAIIITILYIVVIFLEETDGRLYRQRERQQNNMNIFSEVLKVEKCEIGETFNNGKIAITLVSVDENYKGYKENAKIKEGYKVMRADFEFENVGNSKQNISSYKFSCYADKYDCNSFKAVENASFSKSLQSGKKSKCAVYFEVPENSKSISLEYNANNSKNYQTVEFIVK